MKIAAFVLAGLAQVACVGAVQAAIVTYQFTATQTEVFGPPSPGALIEAFAPLTTLSGTFSYDTEAAGGDPSQSSSGYSTGSITFDQIALPSQFVGGIRQIQVHNESAQDPTRDTFFFTHDAQQEPQAVALQLTGPPSVLASSALPASLSLADYSLIAQITVFDATVFTTSHVDYAITSLTHVSPSEIPLPAPFFLMLTGAGALIVAARKRRTATDPVSLPVQRRS